MSPAENIRNSGKSRDSGRSGKEVSSGEARSATEAREHLGAGAMQPKRRGATGSATSTVEDYLKCILNEQSGFGPDGQRTVSTVGMGTLSAALGVAPGTVTAMMKALAESGLVDYAPYTGVTLTESGGKLATHVLRRHRLIELFLVETMGLDWSEVHAEAELLEHAISDRLIARMDEMLGFPTVDPHGDPIPSPDGQVAEQSLTSLLECALNEEQRVVRVLDQSPKFLRDLEAQGLVRDVLVTVVERGDGYVLLDIPLDTLESDPARRGDARGNVGNKVIEESQEAKLNAEVAGKIEVQPG